LIIFSTPYSLIFSFFPLSKLNHKSFIKKFSGLTRFLNVASEIITLFFNTLVNHSILDAVFTTSQIIVISILLFDHIVHNITSHEFIQIHIHIFFQVHSFVILIIKSWISKDAFNEKSVSVLLKITIIPSPKNLSIYHQLFFIISTIPSKYIFNNNKALSGDNFSAAVVNHIISKNITLKFFLIEIPNDILSIQVFPTSLRKVSGINLMKTFFRSS
jgi:hypothetical protein